MTGSRHSSDLKERSKSMRRSYNTLPVTAEIQRIRDDISLFGYARATDSSLGLPEDFRETFARTYFNDDHLRSDVPDIPPDRKRARDVIYYEWHDSRLELDEHKTILIKDRGGIPGEREHSRIELLDDHYASEWVQTCLSLIPVGQRSAKGTFGVNLFRTYTQVVTKPHRDHEKFVIIYVVRKIGKGGMSYLYKASNPEKRVFSETLIPGELIIFSDELFLHGATPLTADGREPAQRDALVCTVDYPKTYLDPDNTP
jgi:hypothetical protein